MYLLGVGGGDEAKRFWFAKVAQAPIEKYFFDDLSVDLMLFGMTHYWEK